MQRIVPGMQDPKSQKEALSFSADNARLSQEASAAQQLRLLISKVNNLSWGNDIGFGYFGLYFVCMPLRQAHL